MPYPLSRHPPHCATQVPGAQHVPLSQGSHFFQNLLSFGLGYATVDPARGELADYEYWDSLPQARGGGHEEGGGMVRGVAW